ncbi:hypothetical protein PROFUN_04572 [Planoprotostelium fungivorum]|uniref:Uncharacterized protein n=1 Tax=Planoprotostelium fungivorum TaxID=1890364 RepID=A0A2P6NBK9_9EUKA|nr:hypothetical protein PROFUN_04572 [Planoprotostelium fungivorum]
MLHQTCSRDHTQTKRQENLHFKTEQHCPRSPQDILKATDHDRGTTSLRQSNPPRIWVKRGKVQRMDSEKANA